MEWSPDQEQYLAAALAAAWRDGRSFDTRLVAQWVGQPDRTGDFWVCLFEQYGLVRRIDRTAAYFTPAGLELALRAEAEAAAAAARQPGRPARRDRRAGSMTPR